MYNIVFSIPIHHRLEVVIDQIINFKHFNPDCAIVFHLSKGFDYESSKLTKDEFLRIINKIGDVYINTESVRTGFADIIQAHLSNFDYVIGLVDFEYFAICSSNEMCFKHGLIDNIRKYDMGVMESPVNLSKWAHRLGLNKDDALKSYLMAKGESNIYFTYPEGQYYRKDVFTKMLYEIRSFYDYKMMDIAYPREEIYFPTIAQLLKKQCGYQIGKPFTYSAYHYTHLWDVSRLELERLLAYKNEYFSIKRVDRELNDNIRAYMRDMFGYVEIEREILTDYGLSLVSFHKYRITRIDWSKRCSAIVNNVPKILLRLGIRI